MTTLEFSGFFLMSCCLFNKSWAFSVEEFCNPHLYISNEEYFNTSTECLRKQAIFKEKKKFVCSYFANRKLIGFIIFSIPFNIILCFPKKNPVLLIIYVVNASALEEGISYSSLKRQAWEKLELPKAVWRKVLRNQISICFDNSMLTKTSGESGLCYLRINKGRRC